MSNVVTEYSKSKMHRCCFASENHPGLNELTLSQNFAHACSNILVRGCQTWQSLDASARLDPIKLGSDAKWRGPKSLFVALATGCASTKKSPSMRLAQQGIRWNKKSLALVMIGKEQQQAHAGENLSRHLADQGASRR